MLHGGLPVFLHPAVQGRGRLSSVVWSLDAVQLKTVRLCALLWCCPGCCSEEAQACTCGILHLWYCTCGTLHLCNFAPVKLHVWHCTCGTAPVEFCTGGIAPVELSTGGIAPVDLTWLLLLTNACDTLQVLTWGAVQEGPTACVYLAAAVQ